MILFLEFAISLLSSYRISTTAKEKKLLNIIIQGDISVILPPTSDRIYA